MSVLAVTDSQSCKYTSADRRIFFWAACVWPCLFRQLSPRIRCRKKFLELSILPLPTGPCNPSTFQLIRHGCKSFHSKQSYNPNPVYLASISWSFSSTPCRPCPVSRSSHRCCSRRLRPSACPCSPSSSLSFISSCNCPAPAARDDRPNGRNCRFSRHRVHHRTRTLQHALWRKLICTG